MRTLINQQLTFSSFKPCCHHSAEAKHASRLNYPPISKHAKSILTLVMHNAVPLAISASILSSPPAIAGIMSGISGIESTPGPNLPEIDFLTKFNEANQKKYADNDARFKSSPILKELLERTKLNKEKNKRAIQDKYCLRGAEWGVGDCSAEGMSPAEREKFIAMLREKTGLK